MPQFEIRPFSPKEAETVAHWVSDPEDVWRLTGNRDQVITGEKVIAWTWETNYTFTLRSFGDLIAYGEIVEDEVDNDVEIQHLLVAPDQRGKGFGAAMLSRLCAFLSAARPYQEVWIRVGRDNDAALRCVEKVGFIFQEAQSGPRYAWFKKSLVRETATAE
jgi:RimJ/RimL family protein N-acetyltransferase